MFEFGTAEYWKDHAEYAMGSSDFWKAHSKLMEEYAAGLEKKLSALRQEVSERMAFGGKTLAEYEAWQARLS